MLQVIWVENSKGGTNVCEMLHVNLLLLPLLKDLILALVYHPLKIPILLLLSLIPRVFRVFRLVRLKSYTSIIFKNETILYKFYDKITHTPSSKFLWMFVLLTVTRMRNISIENAQKSTYACRLMMLVFCLWSLYGIICTRSKVIILWLLLLLF